MDTWRDMGHVLKLWMRLIKEHNLGERRSSFSGLETVRVKKVGLWLCNHFCKKCLK